MSDIVAATRTYLLTQSGVTDLVGSRIYYDNLPQNATLPAVVVYLAAQDNVRHLASADSLTRYAVMLDVFGSTHAAVYALGQAIESAVEMDTGAWGTVNVRRAYVTNVTDTFDEPRQGSDEYRRFRIISVDVWVA